MEYWKSLPVITSLVVFRKKYAFSAEWRAHWAALILAAQTGRHFTVGGAFMWVRMSHHVIWLPEIGHCPNNATVMMSSQMPITTSLPDICLGYQMSTQIIL
jgi:hypothetical protein